ncbi:MAG: FAD binding domain-containing protein [Spirochaetaceae bacterium]|jgi:putative selenate reductase FAD-binding subunit|nr:FAD binding domain-containing protein [Spirochaetaceae bacterium]
MIKEFLKPSNIKEAVKLKKEIKHSFYLGGGTKLNNGGESFGAEVFISLENLNLKGIEIVNGKVKIGAMETLQQLIDSPDIPEFLKQSALGETNRNIRNASTIGGVIAARKSWSTALVGLMALDVEVETADGGIIKIDDYVKSGKDNLIVNLFLLSGNFSQYQNNQRKTANSRPEICIAASIGKSGEKLSSAIVVLGGIADRPIRLTEVESKLIDGTLDKADAVQDSVMDVIVKYTEKLENGPYLNYLSGVIAADCVGRCMRS